jgi:CheY-like chemotaxis protein
MDVDGVPLRSVLVIDDRPEEVKELVDLLKAGGVTVLEVTEEEKARSLLETRPELDLVILDWYLASQTPAEALLILKTMSDHLFAPVVIWTKHSSEVEATDLPIPKSIVLTRDKLVVRTAERLVDEIRKWLSEHRPIKIGLFWSLGVQEDLNRALWDIQTLSGGDLSWIIDSYRRAPIGAESPPPTPQESARELVLLFLKSLRRNQLRNQTMVERISTEVRAMPRPSDGEPTGAGYEKLQEFELYVAPQLRPPIWTGDIVRVEGVGYGIIISPACDIAQGKLQHVQLLKLRPWGEAEGLESIKGNEARVVGNAHPRYHFLPYILGSKNLVCCFEEASSLPLKTFLERRDKGEIEFVSTLDSPYVDNLIQRYTAFLGRLGIPDLARSARDAFLK